MIYFYDDNLVSLDGPTALSFHRRCDRAFRGLSLACADGRQRQRSEAISQAIKIAQGITDKPSLIRVRTVIGYGSPKAGTNKAHGEALGPEATKETKKKLNWPEDKTFYVPDEAKAELATGCRQGQEVRAGVERPLRALQERIFRMWRRSSSACSQACWPAAGRRVCRSLRRMPSRSRRAVRAAKVMDAIANAVPELIGGAADLTTSTKTIFKTSGNFHLDPAGRNIFFGVREFGMCAAVNGMAVHGGLIPYGSTFFTFSDYCKPALRLAALMQAHSSLSSPMIRSRWAKMDRPTSRSSISPCCARAPSDGFSSCGCQ
jgi:transketolase